jgi:hypothetical protein
MVRYLSLIGSSVERMFFLLFSEVPLLSISLSLLFFQFSLLSISLSLLFFLLLLQFLFFLLLLQFLFSSFIFCFFFLFSRLFSNLLSLLIVAVAIFHSLLLFYNDLVYVKLFLTIDFYTLIKSPSPTCALNSCLFLS